MTRVMMEGRSLSFVSSLNIDLASNGIRLESSGPQKQKKSPKGQQNKTISFFPPHRQDTPPHKTTHNPFHKKHTTQSVVLASFSQVLFLTRTDPLTPEKQKDDQTRTYRRRWWVPWRSPRQPPHSRRWRWPPWRLWIPPCSHVRSCRYDHWNDDGFVIFPSPLL